MPKKAMAVKLVIKSDRKRILVVKSEFKDAWQFPGGAVDANEDPEDSMLREVKEEIGWDISKEDIKVVGTVYRVEHDFLFLIYEYTKQVSENTEVTIQEEEIEEYKFVEGPELGGMLSGYYANFLAEYLVAD